MRFRSFFAVLGLAATAACGGGGGGNGGPPAPTNHDYRPSEAGDSFSYAGTTSTAFLRPPQTGGAIPSPNPANTQRLSYTTTQTQTVATGQSYNGDSDATEFVTSESDTLSGGLETTSTTTDEFYSFGASGVGPVHDLGGSSASAGETVTTVIGPNNGLVDVLPEVAGTLPVVADATLTRTETDTDGGGSVRSTAANGTYTETDTFADTSFDGSMESAVANADGSGSVSFPIAQPTNATFVVGAPAASMIPITVTFPASLGQAAPNATATPIVETANIPVWYPQPIALSTQTLVDEGQAAIPSSCNVASSLLGQQSNLLVASSTTVDPVFGELDRRSTSEYTEPGVGVACVALSDVLQQFYDFSGQTGTYVAVGSTPVQTTTTTQTLGLTAETISGLDASSRAPIAAASRARFDALLDRRRRERHARAIRALRASAMLKTGVR
jgi:hypothetical protein